MWDCLLDEWYLMDMGEELKALDPIDDVLEIFMGIPKKRKPKKDILSGDFLL